MKAIEKKINPVLVCKVGSTYFRALASSVAKYISDSARLWPKYLDFCNLRGYEPYKYLSDYAAYLVTTSCSDVSTETDEEGNRDTFGPFRLDNALFAAEVNLIGCPHISDFLSSEFLKFEIRTHFNVVEGRLDASVDIVGRKEEIYKGNNLRHLRDILRNYGFGFIKTFEERITDEPNGYVAIPTLANRSLP